MVDSFIKTFNLHFEVYFSFPMNSYRHKSVHNNNNKWKQTILCHLISHRMQLYHVKEDEWTSTDETNCIFLSLFIYRFIYILLSFIFMDETERKKRKLWHEEKWNKKQLQTQIDELGKLLLLFFPSSIIFSFSSFLFPNLSSFCLIYFHFSQPFFTLSIIQWGWGKKCY